jgi:hypothetical protein
MLRAGRRRGGREGRGDTAFLPLCASIVVHALLVRAAPVERHKVYYQALDADGHVSHGLCYCPSGACLAAAATR